MKDTEQHLALMQPSADANVHHPVTHEETPARPDDFYIAIGSHEPATLANPEDEPEQVHPFIRFINSRHLSEMLDALEQCLQMGGHLFDCTTVIDSAPQDVTDAKALAETFYGRKPTRAQLRKTVDTLGERALSSSGIEPCKHASQKSCYQAYLLRDVIRAKSDLYNHCRLLAFFCGKAAMPYSVAVDISADAADLKKYYSIVPIDFSKPEAGTSSVLDYLYREELEHLLSSDFPHLHGSQDIDGYRLRILNGIQDLGTLDDELNEGYQEKMGALANYAELVFNALTSAGKRKHLSIPVVDGEPSYGYQSLFNPLLPQMWDYFAAGITKEAGKGALSVCPYCKRIFEQKRSTKIFCGNSCASQSARASKSKTADPSDN